MNKILHNEATRSGCELLATDGTVPSAKSSGDTLNDVPVEPSEVPAVSAPGTDETTDSIQEPGFLMDRCDRGDRNNDEVSSLEKTASEVGPDSGANSMGSDGLDDAMVIAEPSNVPVESAPGTNKTNASIQEPGFLMGSYNCSARKEKDGVISLGKFADNVIAGTYRDKVEVVRSAESETELRAAKDNLPCVTVAGVFLGRRKKSQPLEYSGWVCLDIDAKDNPIIEGRVDEFRERLAGDEHVAFAFISVSGKGLAVIFRIDPKRYQEAFDGLCAYVLEHYGLIHDPDCHGDVTRFRFAGYDPGATYNPAEKSMRVRVPPPAPFILNTNFSLNPVARKIRIFPSKCGVFKFSTRD